MPTPTRREILAAFLGLPVALAAGCARKKPPLPQGKIVGAAEAVGHRLRELRPLVPAKENWIETDVVIVGGGIAGLAAAWRLRRAGLTRFVLVELENAAGGTSRSDDSPVASYPWGAHYLPVPMKSNRALIALLKEMGIVEGEDAEGEPVVGEQHLIRDPEQRIFWRGAWHGGDEPYLHAGESRADVEQRERFYREVNDWVGFRDEAGRRAFAIPVSTGSRADAVLALDRITMAEWLDKRGLNSPRLRWMVNYACRDDYGANLDSVSAWAGLFYFASRRRAVDKDSQPFMAWPEGNGRLARHLAGALGDNLRVGLAVNEVVPTEQGVEVIAVDHDSRRVLGWRARKVIFAAPQFVGRYVIRPHRERPPVHLSSFEYSVWLVANLHLKERTRDVGMSLSWDNILYDSPSLGYVSATHQLGADHGPNVWTWYYPLSENDPRSARARLLSLGWDDCADLVLTDLERAHPEIRSLVERLDVMRWGHAMPRPQPGAIWSNDRVAALRPLRGVHFAHSDLSGVGIMEEAFYHGVRAAEEVLTAQGIPSASIL